MNKPKLNQIVAVEKGVKGRSADAINELYKTVQKPELFAGLRKTYQPKDDDGDRLPDESAAVHANILDVLKGASGAWGELLDVTLTKEIGNCSAKADVIVDGKPILKGVPVSFLLQLEKALVDVQTFVGKCPTLDPGQEWTFDEGAGMFRSAPVETHRTQKITEFVVVPGSGVPEKGVKPDVKDVTKDIVAGYWTTVKLSATMELTRKQEILGRVGSLLKAVKYAREEANGIEVEQMKAGSEIFGYLFA